MKRIPWNNLKPQQRSLLLYGGILLGFILWMLFVVTHSWNIHRELNQEIKQLENEKKALQKI